MSSGTKPSLHKKSISISQLLFRTHVSNSTCDSPISPKSSTLKEKIDPSIKIWRRKGYKLSPNSLNESPLKKKPSHKLSLQSTTSTENSAQKPVKTQLFYISNSKLHYEGSVLNCMKEGFGEEFHETGHLKYEGNFRDDLYNDFEATLYYKNGKKEFTGSFENGCKHGKGTEFARNGKVIYTGNFFENQRQSSYAKIYYSDGNIEYEGELVEGEKDGLGKEYSVHAELLYEGAFKKGQRTGKGVIFYKN